MSRFVSMSLSRFLRATLLPALGLALVLGAPGAARAQIDPLRYHSAAVSVTDGQTARLHAYFVEADDGRAELPPGPCRLTLRFLDARGGVLATTQLEHVPGRDTLLDYQTRDLRPGERAALRAEIVAFPDANGRAPRVIPSVEVFDTRTGRTAVADAGQVRPMHDTPEADGGHRFGTVGLISRQVARLNATCIAPPGDTGLPPGPCNVHLALVSGNGAPLVTHDGEVAPGETVSIEFAAGAMVEGIRRRLWAEASQVRAAGGFLTTSLEIYDESTGQSSMLLPGDIVQSWGWE